MKKYLKFFLVYILIIACLVSCGSSITIKDTTPYTSVNNFSYATMKVIEVNTEKETITVEISYTGESELSYGESFEIEIFQDNEWHSLDYKKYTQTDIGFLIESGKTRTEIYRYTRYGKLSAGHYRLIKEVSDYIEPGNYVNHILAAEFDIE